MSEQETQDPRLDGHDRGFPLEAAGLRVSDIADQGWSLTDDFETPIATIRVDHLHHNVQVMRSWCDVHDAELWPHAKTVMSPQLLALQSENGAAGVTAASFGQARLLLEWGASAVLIANQVVQSRAAAWLAARVARTGQQVLSYVDSLDGIRVLDTAARAAGTTLDVLLELGAPGARTGIRETSEAEPLVRELRATPHLRLVGVAGYEGSFGADRSEEALARVDAFLVRQAALLTHLIDSAALDTDRPVFSAGGSMYFDRVAQAFRDLGTPGRLVLRSGCYLLHDTGLFHNATPLPDSGETPGLRAALTVWGTVHSRPEPTRAYLDIGRRDAGFDQGLPRPLRRVPVGSRDVAPFTSATTVQLNDQHLHLELPADSPVRVGDRIEFGISHPCTTMDKWRTLALVDDAGAVVGAVNTRF